jgi:hypothetical protein
MEWGKLLAEPLVEWQAVTKSTSVPGLFHTFTVADDGSIFETNNRQVYGSEPNYITRTELKILDALVDRINREPIPLEPVVFLPDGNDQDRLLTLDNDRDPFEGVITLFSDNSAGTAYAADDKLDFVEIAVLNAYLGYLDQKYDPPFV